MPRYLGTSPSTSLRRRPIRTDRKGGQCEWYRASRRLRKRARWPETARSPTPLPSPTSSQHRTDQPVLADRASAPRSNRSLRLGREAHRPAICGSTGRVPGQRWILPRNLVYMRSFARAARLRPNRATACCANAVRAGPARADGVYRSHTGAPKGQPSGRKFINWPTTEHASVFRT